MSGLIVDNRNKHTKMVDIAVPGDFQAREKEMENVTKYQDWVVEMNKTWNTGPIVVSVVIGALVVAYHFQD